VELVEGDGGLGQVFGHALDEGRAHTDADLGNGPRIAVVLGEVVGERRDGVGPLARRGVEYAGLIDIDAQRDVVVAAPGRGLVEGDPLHAGGIHGLPRFVHIMMDDVPYPGVVLADQPRNRVDRHGGDHCHQRRLEQQSEAAAGRRPGDGDLFAPVAHPRHASVQVGLVL
jgi:hypothetical protein